MGRNIKSRHILNQLHIEFTSIAARFKNRVCIECDISTPTLYRRIREVDRLVDGKVIRVLSNAEKEKISAIAEEITDELVRAVGDILKTGK